MLFVEQTLSNGRYVKKMSCNRCNFFAVVTILFFINSCLEIRLSNFYCLSKDISEIRFIQCVLYIAIHFLTMLFFCILWLYIKMLFFSLLQLMCNSVDVLLHRYFLYA